ncbi:MAG TPA: 4-hydroxyphenylpyruvate dioxygenase [Streptosporangiaceae bacterium]|nr:4-hydroxyphenylpyruvate dioxygenase [Streptosporangiaceae bacterium]
MNIFDIDHIEMYVGDAITSAQFLCAAYGFRGYGHGGPDTGLPGQRSVLLGQGDIRILLTSGLNKDHPASQFVARHGDGVAVIAFRTESAAAAYTDTVAAGGSGIRLPRTWESEEASVVTAEVAGFGDVVYRLVERHGSDAQFQPGAIEMVPDAAPGAGDDLLRLIDHVAVCVPAGELDATIAFHEHVFGFSVIFTEYIEIGDQGVMSKVVQSPSGGVTFTILQPDLSRRAGQIDDFLDWHDGAGVQHVAFLTKDIVRAVRTITGRGVEFAPTPSSYYDMLAERLGETDIPIEALRPLGILVDRDHWGQMYQIFARSTHIRRTLFLELIDRHGARTFGTSNIPALYAAKERELAEIRDTAGSVRV